MEAKMLLERILNGDNMTIEESYSLAVSMLKGEMDEVIVSALLTALRAKGESPEEIAGFAKALRDTCIKPRISRRPLLDTAGTGGDGSNTINASTAAAIISASLGVPVAKHGNRGVSSRSGSADVMRALGYNVEHGAAEAECMVEKAGFAFLYAPLFHPAVKAVMPVRRRLGVRTIFNLVGPLSNPALAERQVLGVASEELALRMSSAATRLGYERLLVVHGEPGVDEVSVSGSTLIIEVEGDSRRDGYRVEPEDLGVGRHSLSKLRVGSPEESAERIRRVLAGAGRREDRDFILANAAAALYAYGKADDLADGLELARQAVDDGIAAAFLDTMISYNKACIESAGSRVK